MVEEFPDAVGFFDEDVFTPRQLGLLKRISLAYEDSMPDVNDLSGTDSGAWARIWDDGRGLGREIPYGYSVAVTDPHADAIFEAHRDHLQRLAALAV